ncbi:MAG TPA: IPT/TIG domain-containing protein [Terriglobales bacterium]|nr:IPT/TIG domain-containing protein [Terriglobales bacterium]
MKLACLFVLVMLFASCGYSSNYNTMSTGPRVVPNISQLSPGSVTAGGPGFVLTVDGSNFGTDASVFWNSTSHSATYLTGQQITTMISAADIANPGNVQVYVHINGKDSNIVMFPVK